MMEDIPERESVLVGTFSFNGHSIVILFDNRATHYFINKACTEKHQLVIEPANTSYVINTPGGRVITKQLVMYIPLNLAGKLFRTSLIVLDSQGIDVILGMSWMRDTRHYLTLFLTPCIWILQLTMLLFSNFHHQTPNILQFTKPLLRISRTFMCPASFRMYSQRIYRVYRQIRM
jgi:hypothetical protein